MIDYDYWIGIYPVTNADFGVFISAHGYQHQAYWSQEGWVWKTENSIQFPEYWSDTKLMGASILGEKISTRINVMGLNLKLAIQLRLLSIPTASALMVATIWQGMFQSGVRASMTEEGKIIVYYGAVAEMRRRTT